MLILGYSPYYETIIADFFDSYNGKSISKSVKSIKISDFSEKRLAFLYIVWYDIFVLKSLFITEGYQK